MHISARNQLKGTIRRITSGPIHAEVTVELEGGQSVTAVITRASLRSLQLRRNRPVIVVIKASDVMIGVCCRNPDCDCPEKGKSTR